MDGRPDEAGELRRRRIVRRDELTAMGVPTSAAPVAGDWLVDPQAWKGLRARLADEARRYTSEHPLEPGAPVEALRQRLGLPDRALVEALSAGALGVQAGRIVEAGGPALPPRVAEAVRAVQADLSAAPFSAPDADPLPGLR